MNLIIEGPAMNLRSQVRRLLPRQRSPKVKKGCSVSVEPCYISILRSPDRKNHHDQSIPEHPIDKVKSYKPIKLKAHLREWLESKRPLKRLSEHKHWEASCSYQTTIGTEYMGCPYDRVARLEFATDCVSPNPRPDKPDSDRPPDYTDHSIPEHVILEVKRSYAVGCIDSIAHSQSSQHDEPSPQITENCPYSIVHDVELVQSPTNNTKPGPDARALAAYFHDFYYNLKPFIYIRSDPGAQIPATTDPNTADIWGNLFSDVAPTALLSVPMLVVVAAWDIDRLHKHTSPNPEPTRYTERSEAAMRSNILKFDQDFRSSGDAAPNPEWQRLKFDDIRKEGEPPILAFDSSTGIKKHTYNSTESGGSYAYEAIQNSQGSGSKGQKFPPKRGYEDDSNEGRKRKKKDQSSRNHSGSPPAKAETFACPFKGGKYPKVIRACDTDFPNLSKVKEHLRRAHFPHLQCPHEGCGVCAGSKFEINRHQKKRHPPLQPLPPAIEQTINLDHLQKHRALSLRTLTWEEISRICFSMDYTREVLGEIHSENGEGNGDEIVDEGDDEVPSPTSGSESQETNGNTPATDFGNEYTPGPEKCAPVPLAGDIHTINNGQCPNLVDAHFTNLLGGEAFWNNTGSGESLQIPPNNTPGEAGPQDYTPNKHPRDSLPKTACLIICTHFEAMRWKLTPRIVSYLRTRSLDEIDISREIDTIFKRLYRLIENQGMADIFAAPDLQTDLPGGPNGEPRFTLPLSTTQQSSYTRDSPWNPHHNYDLFPSPAQIYMGVSADPGTDTPVYCGQVDKTTVHSPNEIDNELLAGLCHPLHQ